MKTILFAEDDPLLIEIYTQKLKESGFSIEVAERGEDVLRRLKEKKFDLLLLDIVLPEFSGWEILEKIRAQEEFKDLKVIILSNLGQKSDVEKGLKMGAAKYLIKAHYTPSEVVKEIIDTLGIEPG